MPLVFVDLHAPIPRQNPFGLFRSNGYPDLRDQQYSWCSSAFNFGCLVAVLSGSISSVKFPLGKHLSKPVIYWSIILMCNGAASSFTSLFILRVLLEIFESIISPGSV
jgi:ACS family allantoate permease-like MFS transporter